MSQYLIFLRPTRTSFLESATPMEQDIVSEHFAYLEAAHQEGKLILAGRTDEPTPTGIVVFEAENAHDAEMFALNDPAISEGIFTFDLRPFRVALSDCKK